MKQLIILLSILGLNAQLFAQTDFCVPGARWIYFSPGSNGPEYQNHIIYEGDTTIGGYSDIHVLKTERRYNWLWEISQNEYTYYVRQSNDSVYELIDGQFELMFDYGVQEGDERVVYIGGGGICSEQDTMVIDSIRSFFYQGQSLQACYFHFLVDDQLMLFGGGYYTGGGGGVYVERLGLMTDHPSHIPFDCWSYNTVVEYVPASFICYTDDELAATYPDTCNLFLDVPVQEIVRAEIISLQNRIQIQNAPNSTVRIYDILGKQLLQERITSDNQTFDLTNLPNGILMVVIEGSQAPITKKIVKLN